MKGMNKIEEVGLQYDFWKKFVRPTMFKLKGYKCENCGATGKLDVHHTTYEVQNIHTLKVLCRKCHWVETFKHNVKLPKNSEGFVL